MPEIKARTRLTFHQLVDGQSSYAHIRYSADGKTFTPASAAALEQAKNWPIEGRNIFILNGATLRYDTRGVFNQVHSLGRLSRVIRKHKDKRLIRVSANVTFRGCTFKSGNLCLLQMNGTTYGWNGTNVYSPGHGSNQTYRVSTVIEVSYGADHDDAGLNIRIDHISGGEVEVTNLQLEFVESVSDPGTPYKPSPEDAAIGTTPGRYRGEVVTDSPIAPIDFNAYTWVDAQGIDAVPVRPNLLDGTDFERNMGGWQLLGNANIIDEGGVPRKAFAIRAKRATEHYVSVKQELLPKLKPNTWYTFSVQCRKGSASAPNPAVAIYGRIARVGFATNEGDRVNRIVETSQEVAYAILNAGEQYTTHTFSFLTGVENFAGVGLCCIDFRNFDTQKSVCYYAPKLEEVTKEDKRPSAWCLSESDKIGAHGDKGDKGDRGERGQKGDNGRSVTAVKTQYYLSTSKAVQQGGAWQDTPPSWQRGKYLWTRLHTSFSDGSSTTTAPVVDSGWEIQGQLQIGGRNLFGFRRGLQYWGLHTVIAPTPGINGISVKMSKPLASGVICRIQKLGFGRPGTYTVSGLIKATKNVRLQLDICDAGHTMVDVTTVLKPFQLTANVTMYWQADNYNGFFDIEAPTGNNLQPGNVIEVHNLMIERGNIASDYRQAEEDATYMQRILEENLRIENVSVGGENGVSFAGRFEARELKNDEYITRSFLNGDTAGTRPAFAAGVEKFGMPTESYATALYHDGSGHIGQMSFTPDGQMYVGRGVIEESKVRFSGLPMPDLNKLNDMLTATSSIGTSVVTAEANAGSTPNSYYRVDATAHSTGQLEVKTPIGQLSVNGRFEVSFVKRMPVEEGTFPFAEGELVLVGVNNNKRYHLASIRTSNTSGYDHETITLDTKLYNLAQGLYRLEVHAWAYGANSVRGKFTPLSATTYVGRIDKPLTSVHTDGILSYQRPDQFAAVKDGKLTVKGEMDIPGVLLAGRVFPDGSPKFYWGSKARKSSPKTQRLQWVGTYRVYHTIGHENYVPIVTGIGDNQHIFGQLTTIAADFFDVCIKNVNGTFVNGKFSFSVFGAN